MTEQLSAWDVELRADIEDELYWDPAVPSANVGVSVTDHAVTVSGTVHTAAEHVAALEAVRRVSGVRAVVDEVVVQHKLGTTDTSIMARIVELLDGSAAVPAGVTATVSDGVVTLSGGVESAAQKEAVEHAVQDAVGAVRIRNEILVESPMISAQTVRGCIVDAFHRSAERDAQDLDVVVERGTVWLTGHVHSSDARQQAENAAWASPGVSIVHNDITIG